MTAHPIDLAIVDGSNVSKSAVRSYEKERGRVSVADADEVRNTNLSGQFAGIYVRSIGSDFDIDTSDTTTADDGVNCIRDLEGNGFFRATVNTSKTQRKVTASGAVTVTATDAGIIVVAKTVGAATSVYLPSALLRTNSVKVVDGKGDAATNNITVIPVSGQSIAGTIDYQWIIDSNGGSVELTPLADGSGWVV